MIPTIIVAIVLLLLINIIDRMGDKFFSIKDCKIGKFKIIFFIIAAIVFYLIATGKTHWITGLFVVLIPIIKKIFIFLRYIPILQRFNSYYKSRKGFSKSNKISKREAAEILGVNENATKEEIIFAHKKAMQKHHPDKGGSKYMAAKINSAKDKLLS